MLFGAFTRLTGPALGCPDWPGCYGSAGPVGAREEISAAQSAVPEACHARQAVEWRMIHRRQPTGVGVLIIVMTISAWVQYRAWEAKLWRGAGRWGWTATCW